MNIKDGLIDIIFPRRCPVCDDLLEWGERLICPECVKKLIPVGELSCRKCGKRLYDESREYCEDCEKERHYFTMARSAFIYNDAMRKSVLRYKNHGRREYAEFYAEAMYALLGREMKTFGAEAILPVPLSKESYRKRGFNQAELIAVKVAGKIGIPACADFLTRVYADAQQKSLSRAERRKNLKKAFKISRNDVKLNRVILLDDVYTTGSTADEISLLLKKAGVRSVMAVSLCSGLSV